MQRLDCDRHVGVLDPEKLYSVQKDFITQRKHRQDAQFTHTITTFQVGREPLNLVELRKQPFDVRVQRERFRSCAQPAFSALKQRKN